MNQELLTRVADFWQQVFEKVEKVIILPKGVERDRCKFEHRLTHKGGRSRYQVITLVGARRYNLTTLESDAASIYQTIERFYDIKILES